MNDLTPDVGVSIDQCIGLQLDSVSKENLSKIDV